MSESAKNNVQGALPIDWLDHGAEKVLGADVYLMRAEYVPAPPLPALPPPRPEATRALTTEEYGLTRWMLEHGDEHARSLLPQLERAKATLWRCPCGCASFNIRVDGYPDPGAGFHPVVGFFFGGDQDLHEVFVYEKFGVLGGVEVVRYTGDRSRILPRPEELRPKPNSVG